MPDAPAFGRRDAGDRSAARPAGPTGRVPIPDGPRPRIAVQTVAVTEAGDLAQKSAAWRLAGDLVAFAGVLVAFLAAILWPDDPLDLSELLGAIYVPGSLSHLLAFDDPTGFTIRPDIDTTIVGDASGTLLAMALLGIAAIMRGRLVLAGLVCVFFLFPWGSVGYRIPIAPAVVCAMAVLAVFRFHRFSVRALLAVGAVAVFAGWLIVPLVLGVFYALLGDEGGQNADYRNVRYARLVENEGKPRTELVDGKTIVRVSSLVPLMMEQESGAAAYVSAQEQALRADAQGARASLDEISARGFAGNALDDDRIRAIERFAAASGAYGPERQEAVQSRYHRNVVAAWAILIVGSVAGLLGLGFDLMAEQVRKRVRRLAELRNRLAGSEPARGTAAGFGLRAAPELQSIAALHGDAVVAAMSTRIRIYRMAAAGLLAASMVAAAAALTSILPAPGSNTAFDTIGIVASALDFARSAGLVPPRETAPPSLLWALMSPFNLSVLGLLALVIFRRAVRPVLVVLVFCFIGLQFQVYIPAGDPRHVVAARDLSPDTRADLEAAMAGNDMPETATGREVKPIAASSAALILAQLAYVEGRPDDAARAMERIGELPASDLLGRRGHSYRQRMGLISEWLETHGVSGLTRHKAELSPARTRMFNAWMTAAAVVSLALAACLMGLAFYAGARRATVRSLVDERRALFRAGVA